MRVLFLDIDGVLNSDLWYKSNEKKLKKYPYDQFDPRCVKLLNAILENINAEIVVSSTWRLKYTLEELNAIFKEVGIQQSILDYTPVLTIDNNFILRGNEILKWCQDNQYRLGIRYLEYKDFAILDDITEMLYWQKDYFFKTDRYIGLTPSIAKQIIRQFK